jgi:hypothetical protein
LETSSDSGLVGDFSGFPASLFPSCIIPGVKASFSANEPKRTPERLSVLAEPFRHQSLKILEEISKRIRDFNGLPSYSNNIIG